MYGVSSGKEIELASYLNKPLTLLGIKRKFKGLVIAINQVERDYYEVKEFIHEDDPSYKIWHNMLVSRGFTISRCQ